MNVSVVDLSATTGRTALHGASPRTKVAAFVLVLAAVVLQSNVLVILAIAMLLTAVVLGSGLPARHVFTLAAYPAVFALLFAFAGASDLLTGALIVSKAVTAALAAVILAFTTPYPQLFAPLQAVTPGIVGDAMLMTYRSLFLLGEKFSHLLRAVRLRSGLSRGHPLRAARATAQALGGLVLHAFDLSQREYDVMRLRGYEDRLRVAMPPARSRAFDATLLGCATLVLLTAAMWRAGAAGLNPFSWIPLAGATLALGVSLPWRWLRR